MKPQNETPAPAPRPSGSPFSIRHLLPGLAIGMLLGIVGLLTFQNHLPGLTKALYTITLISFGVVVLSFLIVFVFRQLITRKLLGENSAGDFLNDAQTVADAVTDQLAKNVLVNVTPETSERVRKALPLLANWFIWGRLRNWWWNWILGVFISLGGLTGTILLMNQNDLLEAQNKKIDRQMQLEEANRRSALVVLMSNIMDKVDREIESQQPKGLSMKAKEQEKYALSQSLIGQIAALSHSFKPYRYMDGDTLIGRPLSPERGQLLITITRLPLDTAIIHQIFYASSFAYADLKGTGFDGLDLKGINLSGADLSETGLSNVDFRNANLQNAKLNNSYLDGANLSGADLSYTDMKEAGMSNVNMDSVNICYSDLEFATLKNANLRNAYCRGGNLNNTDFSGADLSGSEIRDSDVKYANFKDAILRNVVFLFSDLSGANLKNADLSEADLSETNLENADLTKANLNNVGLSGVNFKNTKFNLRQFDNISSIFECKIPDSLRTFFINTNPNIFENSKEKHKRNLDNGIENLLKDIEGILEKE